MVISLGESPCWQFTGIPILLILSSWPCLVLQSAEIYIKSIKGWEGRVRRREGEKERRGEESKKEREEEEEERKRRYIQYG